MKKNAILFITVLLVISLVAYGFVNKKDLQTEQPEIASTELVNLNAPMKEHTIYPKPIDIYYGIGTRFGGFKKQDIDNATSINDFFHKDQVESIVSLKSLEIIIIENEERTDKREIGTSKKLTAAQLKLIQSFDYSTNFLVRIDFKEKNTYNDGLHDNYSSPHLTVVPEKEANYVNGEEALIKYLKENSKDSFDDALEKKLRAAKLYFTVTSKGTITNLRLDRTCGYESIDKKMIELITNMPGKWEPAENYKGEKVNQELVFTFGLMGC